MIKLALLIAFYKRPEITRVVMRHYRRMTDQHGELALVAVGSEGRESQELAESNGWIYVEAPNKPLSDKLSFGLDRCREENPSMGLVAMGSDDIVTKQWIFRCQREHTLMLGLRDMYLLQRETWMGLHWKGYLGDREGESIGAHRFFPRHLLERVDWKLWPAGLNRNLDGNLHRHLKIDKHDPDQVRVYSMQEQGCAALGISSETNLTPWHMILPGAVNIDPDDILRQFPPETVADILSLRG